MLIRNDPDLCNRKPTDIGDTGKQSIYIKYTTVAFGSTFCSLTDSTRPLPFVA